MGNEDPAIPRPKPLWERNGCLEIALAGICLLVFFWTTTFGFVYDDRDQVLGNAHIQSWKYAARDLTEEVWTQNGGHPIKYYRPVFIVWMRLNYSLFGAKPWGWHLSTVLLHALASVLVFRLALKLFRNRWQALIAGSVFALHPVHVESVAWVSGVTDPLLAVFFLTSFLCFLRWKERRSGLWLGAALALAFLAMLAKEPGITLPAVVFVYAWIFQEPSGGKRKRTWYQLRSAIFDAAPFALPAIAYLVLRHIALTTPSQVLADSGTALLTLPGLLLFYIRLAFWPVGLTLFYERQYIERLTFHEVVIPILLLALIAAILAVFLRRDAKKKEAIFSVAFALLTLGPVLCVRWFAPDDFVHDRYLYLPLAGFAMLLSIVITKLGGKDAPNSLAPARQIAAISLLAVAMSFSTVISQSYWANDLVLWSHCYKFAPQNLRVLNNLASSLGDHGDYQSAAPLFLEILRQKPDDAMAYANLGYTFYRMGELPSAERYLGNAVRLDPSDAHSMVYLGITHYKLRQPIPAESELRRAIALDPSTQGAHLALSVVLEQQGDLAGALRETVSELTYHPEEQQGVAERLHHLQLLNP
ncbi:MAG TPA: tetratricopeptide repeat protein [Terriglobales bacterium]|nr:tetratricopeptide repeat protein [Terriglobales bacterium]